MRDIIYKGEICANLNPNIIALISSFLSGRKTSTIQAYRQDLQEFCDFQKVKDLNLAVLSLLTLSGGQANALILQYKNHLIDNKKYQSATINRRLAAIRSLVKLARTLGLVSWSIEIKNQEHQAYRDVKGIDSQKINLIFEYLRQKSDIKAIRDYSIFRLLFDLGLRREEVCTLNFENIDLESSKIWINGKGRSEKELLSLPQPTKEAIQAWIKIRGNHQGALFYRLDKASNGKLERLTGTGLFSIVKELGSKVGIKNISVHKIRHSAITACCEVIRENDLGIEKLIKFSRHKNLNTALIYMDHLENAQQELSSLVAKKVK